MNEVYLLTGGNIGNRVANLQQACDLIEQRVGTTIAASSIYETAPWGITDQPAFVNQVLRIRTHLSPAEVLKQLLKIEEVMGRTRALRYGPRIIDIDILLYNDIVVQAPDLIIPHPEMANRRFVMVPLNEIAPGVVHPVYHKTVQQLLAACEDQLSVYPLAPADNN